MYENMNNVNVHIIIKSVLPHLQAWRLSFQLFQSFHRHGTGRGLFHGRTRTAVRAPYLLALYASSFKENITRQKS